MEIVYCRRCGTRAKFREGIRSVCESGHSIYANPLPTASIFLVHNNRVLLATRGIEPGKGKLDSIGGFVDGNESFEQAAYRELQEEASLEPHQIGPLRYLTSSVGIYNFEGEPLQALSLFFVATFDPAITPTPHDDVASLDWFTISDIPLEKLHADDVHSAVVALQQYFASR